MRFKERNVLVGYIVRQAIGRGGQIAQPAAGGLLHPGIIVAIAVKDNALVRADGIPDQGMQGILKAIGLFQDIGILAQRLGHGRIEGDVAARNGHGRAHRAEFKLIAGKGKGRCAVAVGGIARKARQGMHAHAQQLLFLCAHGRIVFNGFQDARQLVTQEHAHNGRRRFAGAQAAIVARAGHGDAHHLLIIVHGLQHRAQKQQKLRVLAGRIPRLHQVDPGISDQRPVVVLARTVYARKGLFVQQAHHAVLLRHLFHYFHGQLIMIGGNIDHAVDGRKLMLRGSHLVMLGLGRHAQLPQFAVELMHKGRHTGLDHAVIMIVQLLTLGRLRAVKGAAGIQDIAALGQHIGVDQEILLLRADAGTHGMHIVMAEQLYNPHGLAIERLHGAQQRGFFIQRFAAIAAKRRGNAQHAILDKGVTVGIPSRIAAGLKGSAQTARREGGSVRFALDQFLARKLHDGAAIVRGTQKRLMLFGGDARHGLEPVRIVGSALFNGPVLHGLGHRARHRRIQLMPAAYGTLERAIHIAGQALSHHAA